MSRGDRREDIFRDDVDRLRTDPSSSLLLVCSSAGTPAGLAARLPAGRQVDRLLGEHGIGQDSAGGWAERIFAEELDREGSETPLLSKDLTSKSSNHL